MNTSASGSSLPSPVRTASYWLVDSGSGWSKAAGGHPGAPVFWVEQVRSTTPCTFRQVVAIEQLQPYPERLLEWGITPVRATARFTSDRQAVQVAFHWSVWVRYADPEGEEHRAEKVCSLRRELWAQGVEPGMGVRVLARGSTLRGTLQRTRRWSGFRGEVALLGLVQITEGVPLRAAWGGEPLAAPLPLPLEPVSQENSRESPQGRERPPREGELPPERLSPERDWEEDSFRPPVVSAVPVAWPAPEDAQIQGWIQLEPGWHVISISSTLCRQADGQGSPGGKGLLVTVSAGGEDGAQREARWIVGLPASLLQAAEPEKERVIPLPGDEGEGNRPPASALHLVSMAVRQSARSNAPVVSGPPPAPDTREAVSADIPRLDLGEPGTAAAPATSAPAAPPPGAAAPPARGKEVPAGSQGEPLVWRLPQPVFPASPAAPSTASHSGRRLPG